jgi:hypothetical protein
MHKLNARTSSRKGSIALHSGAATRRAPGSTASGPTRHRQGGCVSSAAGAPSGRCRRRPASRAGPGPGGTRVAAAHARAGSCGAAPGAGCTFAAGGGRVGDCLGWSPQLTCTLLQPAMAPHHQQHCSSHKHFRGVYSSSLVLAAP